MSRCSLTPPPLCRFSPDAPPIPTHFYTVVTSCQELNQTVEECDGALRVFSFLLQHRPDNSEACNVSTLASRGQRCSSWHCSCKQRRHYSTVITLQIYGTCNLLECLYFMTLSEANIVLFLNCSTFNQKLWVTNSQTNTGVRLLLLRLVNNDHDVNLWKKKTELLVDILWHSLVHAAHFVSVGWDDLHGDTFWLFSCKYVEKYAEQCLILACKMWGFAAVVVFCELF